LILFSTVLLIIIVDGTIWMMFNLTARMARRCSPERGRMPGMACCAALAAQHAAVCVRVTART
jgi:hypothetical protein